MTNEIIIYNFNTMFDSKIQVSEDASYVREIKNNGIVHYKKDSRVYGREKYVKIDEYSNERWRNAIGHNKGNGRIQIDSIFLVRIKTNNVWQGSFFSNKLVEAIMNNEAYEASDTSYKNNEMGGH